MSDYTSQPEPAPTPTTDNTAESMHDRVIELVKRRKEFGLAKYGSTLAAFNGRDPLNDAMDEALDLPGYIEQARVERDAMLARIADLEAALWRAANGLNAATRFSGALAAQRVREKPLSDYLPKGGE